VRPFDQALRLLADIVQFVPMRDFLKPDGVDRMGFSRALLEELPEQITQYFGMNQIAPLAPRSGPPPVAIPPVIP
jgi:hypothetical protein